MSICCWSKLDVHLQPLHCQTQLPLWITVGASAIFDSQTSIHHWPWLSTSIWLSLGIVPSEVVDRKCGSQEGSAYGVWSINGQSDLCWWAVQVSDPQFFLVHWLCNITKIHVGLLDDLIMSRPVFFLYALLANRSGGPALRESAHYPRPFAEFIYWQHMSSLAPWRTGI